MASDYSNTPVDGVVYSEATVLFRRVGDTEFQIKTLESADWIPLEDGFYALKWKPEELSAIGPVVYQIYGPEFDLFIDKFDVVFTPLGSSVTTSICIVFGNLKDLGGIPAVNKTVVFRPLRMPYQYQGSFISADPIHAIADANGNFTATLLRGMQCLVSIEQAGISQQIIIPDVDSVPLLDLLPPVNG
jgi:hypothetical protein